MKTFELSSRKMKNGRRKFKAILYEIFPDSCVDEKEQVGTQFNENGITWIREYCEQALPSIKGMSLKCEFLDDERTELCGHGESGFCVEDGLPLFENAVMIGTFEKGYIDEIETPNGGTKIVCIGEGTIDGLCYHNLCEKLEEEIENGQAPHGSVEILKTGENEGIVYKYGYKPKGRIPTIFEHSGYVLLGVRPADQTAKILELNSKEDKNNMDEKQVKALVGEVVEEAMKVTAEMNKCKEECAAQVSATSESVAEKDKQIAELNAKIDSLNSELEACKNEKSELNAANESLQSEVNSLKATVAEAEKKEKINEMNSAIASFSDDEKAYAQAEIDAFNADPIASEINSVVSKIWEGIGKKAKTEATVAAEQNAAKTNVEDIFAEIEHTVSTNEDVNIF